MGVWSWLKRALFGGDLSPFPPGTGPARLLVMRHAEKTGDKSDHHLSPEGQRRAERLAAYVPNEFGKPDFLIAARRNSHSDRPVDTLKPLAAALGLAIDDHLSDEDAGSLVEMLRGPAYRGGFGVISWRHSDLPRILKALGAPHGSVPDPWDSAVYDLMIELRYQQGLPPEARRVREPF